MSLEVEIIENDIITVDICDDESMLEIEDQDALVLIKTSDKVVHDTVENVPEDAANDHPIIKRPSSCSSIANSEDNSKNKYLDSVNNVSSVTCIEIIPSQKDSTQNNTDTPLVNAKNALSYQQSTQHNILSSNNQHVTENKYVEFRDELNNNNTNDTDIENAISNKSEEQSNNLNSDYKIINLNDKMVNIASSAATTSKKATKNNIIRKRRTRNRKKRTKKTNNIRVENNTCNNVSKILQKPVSIQKKTNSCTGIDQSGVDSCTSVQEQPTCSPDLQTTKNYDFSKLKWLKPLSSLSSPPHLQIVIIDRNNPHWRIANDTWLMIEKRLLEALHNEMVRSSDTSIGLFDGAKWQRGIKIVGCENKNAFNFIRKFFANFKRPWYGTHLDLFPVSYIARHIVKTFIPPPVLKIEMVMSLIKLQNPSVSIRDWKIVREAERPHNSGVDIWLSINNESYEQLCRLRGEIKYGLNRIWVNPT